MKSKAEVMRDLGRVRRRKIIIQRKRDNERRGVGTSQPLGSIGKPSGLREAAYGGGITMQPWLSARSRPLSSAFAMWHFSTS